MTNFASGYCETLPVVIDAAGCGLANPFGVRGIPPETFPGDGARAPDLVRQLREAVLVALEHTASQAQALQLVAAAVTASFSSDPLSRPRPRGAIVWERESAPRQGRVSRIWC